MGSPRKRATRRTAARSGGRSGAPDTTGPFSIRFTLVAMAIGAGFLVVVLKLVQLQIIDSAKLSARAESQHLKSVRLAGERGTITDRNGAILAKNMDVPSISANPSAIKNPKATARALSRLLPVSARTLEKRFSANGRHFTWVHRKTDPALAGRIMDLGLTGVHQLPESRRFYPKGKLLGHILGFAGIDNQGLSGVERVFDSRLKGGEIHFVVERDALGNQGSPTNAVYERPDSGADITLTIDEVIQYHVEKQLDLAMARTEAKSASVVVMAPDSGEILAMAVRPEFDPNRPGSYVASDFRNRILTDPYEPGSTMKVLIAATALEQGVVTLDEVIDCENGYLSLRGGPLRDSHPHDMLTFHEVLAKSSNIGTYKVADRIGPQGIYDALRKFGLGQRTGIELGGESTGVLLPVSRWSGRSLASISIGQELSVTPLQLATAASAVANGGWLIKPHIVREIRDDHEVDRTRPIRVRRVISDATSRTLLDALVAVTEKGGTAVKAAIPGYRVAGKTGTAQKAAVGKRGYAKGKYVSSFLGMVPAEDPKLVILVVIDEPKGRYYGGTVAAPVFRDVARPVLQYMGVHPETDRKVVLSKHAL
ncbi:MAG: peptidoglycan D,D-transpeptidase FtsI family protein [Leptospirillia bacterium]